MKPPCAAALRILHPPGAVPSLLRHSAACPSSVLEHQLVRPQIGQGFCLVAWRQPSDPRLCRGLKMGSGLGLPSADGRSRLDRAAKVAAVGPGACIVVHNLGLIPQLPHAAGRRWSRLLLRMQRQEGKPADWLAYRTNAARAYARAAFFGGVQAHAQGPRGLIWCRWLAAGWSYSLGAPYLRPPWAIQMPAAGRMMPWRARGCPDQMRARCLLLRVLSGPAGPFWLCFAGAAVGLWWPGSCSACHPRAPGRAAWETGCRCALGARPPAHRAPS